MDLLRACAVLLVLIDHTLKFYGVYEIGGFPTFGVLGGVGVAFFFVHTCTVLMMSLERLHKRYEGRHLFGAFCVRRAFRIFSLSMVFVLLVWKLNLPSGYITSGAVHVVLPHPTLGDLLSNLLLIQNLTYRTSILGVLWGLPLEVQMYLFLPLLFVLISRWKSPVFLLSLWVVSIGLAFVQPVVSARLNVFQFVPRFLPGVIAAALLKQVRLFLPSFLWPMWLIGLTVGFIAAGETDEHYWVLCLGLGLSLAFFREIR